VKVTCQLFLSSDPYDRFKLSLRRINLIFSGFSPSPFIWFTLYESAVNHSKSIELAIEKKSVYHYLFQKVKDQSLSLGRIRKLKTLYLKDYIIPTVNNNIIDNRKRNYSESGLENNRIEDNYFEGIDSNILQIIILQTNDWETVKSSKLVSKLWNEILTTEQCLYSQIPIMLNGIEGFERVMKIRIQQIYDYLATTDITFPVYVASLFMGVNENQFITAKFSSTFRDILDAYSEDEKKIGNGICNSTNCRFRVKWSEITDLDALLTSLDFPDLHDHVDAIVSY
jgi:hypothetical protein